MYYPMNSLAQADGEISVHAFNLRQQGTYSYAAMVLFVQACAQELRDNGCSDVAEQLLERWQIDIRECDGCGRRVPADQIESRFSYGCEGSFCLTCRGQEGA